jgi:hypothetical protein
VYIYKVGVQVQYISNDLLAKQIQIDLERGFVMHACNEIHMCEEGYHGAKPHLLVNISSWARVASVSWNGAREGIGLHQKIIILPILI